MFIFSSRARELMSADGDWRAPHIAAVRNEAATLEVVCFWRSSRCTYGGGGGGGGFGGGVRRDGSGVEVGVTDRRLDDHNIDFGRYRW